MIVPASSVFRSDLATTLGPIARACGANAWGSRAARNGHVDVFTGKGEALTYLAESYNRIAHDVSPLRVDIDSPAFKGAGLPSSFPMTSPFVSPGSASCSSFAVQTAMPLFNVFVDPTNRFVW
jgi:hypothetical protein